MRRRLRSLLTQHAIMSVNTNTTSAYTALFPCQMAKIRKLKMAPDEKTTRHAPRVLKTTAVWQWPICTEVKKREAREARMPE